MTMRRWTWTPRAFPISWCRQFGIKRDTPDLSRLEELYEGWDPQQRRSALDQIQGMSKQFGGSIERNITPQQRSRIPPQRQSR